MKFNTDQIRKLAEMNLGDESLFVVAVKISQHGKANKLKIILDGDNGITIDQCAEISRKMSNSLDEDDQIDDPFTLEVTSPGLDHPIELFRQYVKNVGRKVKVILKDNTEAKGTLKSVNESFIQLEKEIKTKERKETKHEMVEIPFDKILQTNIQISFK